MKTLIATATLGLFCAPAFSVIPESNVNYAVLIEAGEGMQASGFILLSNDRLFLITAKHVLIQDSGDLRSATIRVNALETLGQKEQPSRMLIALGDLSKQGALLVSADYDAAAVWIGRVAGGGNLRTVQYRPEVQFENGSGVTVVASPNTATMKQVIPSADVYVCGYPNSLGFDGERPWDERVPIVRRGVVAGVNPASLQVILDCRVDRGNSGGPAIQLTKDENGADRYCVIGLVSSWVPQTEQWVNHGLNQVNHEISNSGYSTIVPMDVVNALVAAESTSLVWR